MPPALPGHGEFEEATEDICRQEVQAGIAGVLEDRQRRQDMHPDLAPVLKSLGKALFRAANNQNAFIQDAFIMPSLQRQIQRSEAVLSSSFSGWRQVFRNRPAGNFPQSGTACTGDLSESV